jgi:hypothetical protein
MPDNKDDSGLKYDQGKIDWHSFPLVCLKGLIKVAEAGCKKYERFNCLKPFDNGSQRFFSASLRHTVACQIDPLSVDEETGCRHGYEAAWNMIMRTYHAEQAENVVDRSELLE